MTIRLIKRWPKEPCPLAAQLRVASTRPSQALAQRLGR
jgi:hypothetical protein